LFRLPSSAICRFQHHEEHSLHEAATLKNSIRLGIAALKH
jgi:hypothetical protein